MNYLPPHCNTVSHTVNTAAHPWYTMNMKCPKHLISLVDNECIACTRGTEDVRIYVLNKETVCFLPPGYYIKPSENVDWNNNKVVSEHDKMFPGRHKGESRKNHLRRLRKQEKTTPFIQLSPAETSNDA